MPVEWFFALRRIIIGRERAADLKQHRANY